MKIGVIGYGSIGKRHCENLIHLGHTDITLLRMQKNNNELELAETVSIENFFKTKYDFIIISTPSSLHFEYLKKIIPENINVLVEKPVVTNEKDSLQLRAMLKYYSGIGMCSYNLRFHPSVIKVVELLRDSVIGKIHFAKFFVGQFLPEWRPSQNYQISYSASKQLGGGVVLDLIHEIDLATFLLGYPKNDISAVVAKISDLVIETEDIAEISYLSSNDVLVNIHLDYISRKSTRIFTVYGSLGVLECDLLTSTIRIFRPGKESEEFGVCNFQRNEMYLKMMSYYISCINNHTIPSPSITDGLNSLDLALKIKKNETNYK